MVNFTQLSQFPFQSFIGVSIPDYLEMLPSQEKKNEEAKNP